MFSKARLRLPSGVVQRFYDRFNTDPDDYFWLDTSGYGAGVSNIDVGIGKLSLQLGLAV